MRIDAHQHFWQYRPDEYPWMQADWPIRRDFLPEDLEPLLVEHGFAGSIAVQARQSPQETQWLLALAKRHSSIKGVVGWLDLRADRVRSDLESVASDSRLVGIRHVAQDEVDDRFLVRPDFARGIARLEEFDLTYDLLIFPRQLPAAIELAQRFPQQKFVLDHIAKPNIKEQVISPWREQVRELAKCPNVMCKVSGLVTEAKWGSWENRDFAPYLDVVYEAFGFDRLMYGSDWPVCLLSASYDQVLGLTLDWLSGVPERDREAVLGGNARRFYLGRGGQLT